MNEHPSASIAQQDAETELLHMLGGKLGYDLKPHKIKLNKKCTIQIDGYSADGRILCEVYAHIGTLRGSQPDKIAADVLKLNLAAERKGGRWRKILLFADGEACKMLRGSSWLAEACKENQVEIEVAEIGQRTRQKIEEAQKRQKMMNAE